jgi:hypothetical protein
MVGTGRWPKREKLFKVHHDLITERSEFFRAARSVCWIKRSRVTKLVGAHPYIFSAYLNCLYLGAEFMTKHRETMHVEGNLPAEHNKSKNLTRENNVTVAFLIDLYILADKLLDPITANLVIDELIAFVGTMSCVPGAGTVNLVYSRTADCSPLRRLCRDWQLHERARDWVLKKPKAEWNLPLEFLQDLLIKSARLQVETPSMPIREVFTQSAITRAKGHYHRKVEQKSKADLGG